jgi:Fis family transcriptional regulator, factor for inversion stimulation protein
MNQHDPLAAAVRTALEDYLQHLDGESPQGLYDMVLLRIEKPLLELIVRHAGGNQTRAAEMLGINRNTLRKKLSDHGLL